MNSANGSHHLALSALAGNLAVLGSTGSIGQQTLDVVRANQERFSVKTLAAHRNVDLLVSQVEEFRPIAVAVADPEAGEEVKRRVGKLTEVLSGPEGVIRVASHPEVHSVVAAVVGFAGLPAVFEAIRENKHIALANKEALVAAGPVFKRALEASSSVLVPTDSEHNSIFQCLLARRTEDPIRRIILTASGGPFFQKSQEELAAVSAEEALCHPRWNMGAKISLDSATMMNKGLEVIEAALLFDLRAEQIEVLIHPQSLLHGLIEFLDGSTLAALYETDMRIPIAHALSFLRSSDPESSPGERRVHSGVSFLDLADHEKLEFYRPDLERFPALGLAYKALEQGESLPTVLNAANEVAGDAFIGGRISFLGITDVVARTMAAHRVERLENFGDVLRVDAWGREFASNLLEGMSTSKECS